MRLSPPSISSFPTHGSLEWTRGALKRVGPRWPLVRCDRWQPGHPERRWSEDNRPDAERHQWAVSERVDMSGARWFTNPRLGMSLNPETAGREGGWGFCRATSRIFVASCR